MRIKKFRLNKRERLKVHLNSAKNVSFRVNLAFIIFKQKPLISFFYAKLENCKLPTKLLLFLYLK